MDIVIICESTNISWNEWQAILLSTGISPVDDRHLFVAG